MKWPVAGEVIAIVPGDGLECSSCLDVLTSLEVCDECGEWVCRCCIRTRSYTSVCVVCLRREGVEENNVE